MKDEILETKAVGSNGRRWMDAYRAMLNKLDALKSIPKPLTHDQHMYIHGFEDAANVFKQYAFKKNGEQ